jgi:hypothetical protein
VIDPAPGDSSREHHADERARGDQFPTGSGLARSVACWINYARSISPANRSSAKKEPVPPWNRVCSAFYAFSVP